MEKELFLIITKGTAEDIESAQKLRGVMWLFLQDHGFLIPEFKVIPAPKYKHDRSNDFVIRRNQLFDEIRSKDPRLAIFLASNRDKLMEQTCSVLSRVENFDCCFVYLFFGKNPEVQIRLGKGISMQYKDNDVENAKNICEYLMERNFLRKPLSDHKSTDELASTPAD